MTRIIGCTAALLLAASAASAQAPTPAPPQKITLAQGLQRSYEGVKRNLTEIDRKSVV